MTEQKMNMVKKLKPCPFCGRRDSNDDCISDKWNTRISIVCNEESPRHWFVFCGNCGVRTFDFPSDSAAISAWNRRVSDDEPRSIR